MFLCPTCLLKLRVVPKYDWLYQCKNCGEFDIHDTIILPQRSMEHLLSDPHKALWWHATTEPNWLKRTQEAEIWVHVGAWRAAKMIMRQRNQPEYDLYKLRLKKAIVGPVVNDSNDFPYLIDNGDTGQQWHGLQWHSQNLTTAADTVYPYINRYESPGSVSLLINPNYLEIIEKRRESV